VAADRTWAQDPAFDAATMTEFERRLQRARPTSRQQYLRVKGAVLLSVDEPSATQIAIGLLTRAIVDYPPSLQTSWSHELLAEAYRRTGDLGLAEQHLRDCLAVADDWQNGSVGRADLALVEVLLAQQRTTESCEALDQVDTTRLQWNTDLYRYAVARARCERASGRDPRPWAVEALRLSEVTEPQLPQHPKVGLVKSDPATLREMRQLARRSRRRWRSAP
jgi:hypothetical protein